MALYILTVANGFGKGYYSVNYTNKSKEHLLQDWKCSEPTIIQFIEHYSAKEIVQSLNIIFDKYKIIETGLRTCWINLSLEEIIKIINDEITYNLSYTIKLKNEIPKNYIHLPKKCKKNKLSKSR